MHICPADVWTYLRRRISVCVFPSGQVRFAQQAFREFCPTRRHGAILGHRPTQSIKHAVKSMTRTAKRKHQTRTFPILWDITVTGRKWLENEVGQTRTNSVRQRPGPIVPFLPSISKRNGVRDPPVVHISKFKVIPANRDIFREVGQLSIPTQMQKRS